MLTYGDRRIFCRKNRKIPKMQKRRTLIIKIINMSKRRDSAETLDRVFGIKKMLGLGTNFFRGPWPPYKKMRIFSDFHMIFKGILYGIHINAYKNL